MPGDVKLNWKERTVLSLAAFIGVGLWLGLLWLPWTSKARSHFPAAPPAAANAAQPQPIPAQPETTDLQSVLSQLGTYGDMFGILNCLFTGAAFWGVIYALILQSRDLKNQHMDMQRGARSAELQNRLAAYQSLADHHRYQLDKAGDDILLRARSKGRERAFAELMDEVLNEIENPTPSNATRPPRNYHHHPARIRNLNNMYQEDLGLVENPDAEFGPVKELLLWLVEEIAAMVELTKRHTETGRLLDEAGDYVNRAVEPRKVMQLEFFGDKVARRRFEIESTNNAFRTAIQAVRSLGSDN